MVGSAISSPERDPRLPPGSPRTRGTADDGVERARHQVRLQAADPIRPDDRVVEGASRQFEAIPDGEVLAAAGTGEANRIEPAATTMTLS